MKKRSLKDMSLKSTVKELCFRANTVLREDVREALAEACSHEEEGSVSRRMLEILIENARIASEAKIPICQDTGHVAVFLEIGNGIDLSGCDISEVVNGGVEEAYSEYNFRKSVVKSPVERENTGTNTPCIIHTDIVAGDEVAVSVMPKGFGSENKSVVRMFNPTDDMEKIKDFCVGTVKKTGADACPPYVLGIGMGGTMEKSALLAKKALLRPVTQSSGHKYLAEAEKAIMDKCNALGIGVMGLGGRTTVMGVNIEEYPTHIAGLPVAINVCCHALRSAGAVI
jgi:fumarate hydratase subunit alpha